MALQGTFKTTTKMKTLITDDLRAFLIEKGVLDEFMLNAEVYWKGQKITKPLTIKNAFLWGSTRKTKFWSDLDDEFDSREDRSYLINYYTALFEKATDGELPCDLSSLTTDDLKEAILELQTAFK